MKLIDVLEKQMRKRAFRPIKNYIEEGQETIKALPESPEFGFFTWFRIFRENNIKIKYKIAIKAIPYAIRAILGIRKSFKDLKYNPKNPHTTITPEGIYEFEEYAKSIGVDKVGYIKLTPELILEHQELIYDNVIVFIKEMDKTLMALAPHKKTMVMIMKTYYQMGKQANKLSKYLRKKGFSVHAGPALAGLSLYPVLAQRANLGAIGRHGLLITPEFGPRQRIAVIYTNITNLPVAQSNTYGWISEFCKTCVNCMEACPTNAIYETSIQKAHGRLTHIDVGECAKGFLNYGCSICIKECTFNKNPSEKIRQIAEKEWKSNKTN
ncbi:MAG: [Fe-S]-binding protein [Candidatus Hermodarchaeota archaeon]